MGYRSDVLDSWVHSAPSVRGLAATLGVGSTGSLRGIVDRLAEVESFTVETDINSDDDTPINGHVGFDLYSDGRYRFFGHMRATGFTSYQYGVQGSVSGAGGAIVSAQRTGDVYGTDTPGDRQDDWSQDGTEPGIAMQWASLRGGQSGIGYTMNADMSGVLGVARDVLEFAAKGIVANAVLGPIGWAVLVGSELADIGVRIGSPDILAGLVTAGGVLWVLGPYGLIPAIVGGIVVADATGVSHRSMLPDERTFADQVFNGTVDYDRVTLTDLSHGGGKAYTVPSVDDSILVNLGDDYHTPMTSTSGPKSDYSQPGSRFIHELTHAWQITNNSFFGMLCGMSSDYSYHLGSDEVSRTYPDDHGWTQKAWGDFNNEQQAHIVDDFYGARMADLFGPDALGDPAYPFIRDHIRAGQT